MRRRREGDNFTVVMRMHFLFGIFFCFSDVDGSCCSQTHAGLAVGMRILSISKGGSKISVDLSEVAYASHHSIQLAFPAAAVLHARAGLRTIIG